MKQVLIFNSDLAKEIGLYEAIILQKVYYWQNKLGVGRWIYNSYEQWQQQFPFMSVRSVRRVFKCLIDLGFVESRRSQFRNGYRLCIDVAKSRVILSKSTNCLSKVVKLQNISSDKSVVTNGQDNCDEYPSKPIHMSRCAVSCSETTTRNKNTLSLNPSLSSGMVQGKGLSDKRKGELEVLKEIIRIWKSHIPGESQLELSAARSKILLFVFAKHFESSIEKWRNFVLHITKSEFLMGGVTGFQVYLDWILCESNLDKILSGRYHFSKDLKPNYVEGKRNRKPLDDLESNVGLDSRWKNTLHDLIGWFGEDTYISWFSKLSFCSVREGVLVLKATSGFVRDYTDTHFGKRIYEIGKKYFQKIRGVKIIVLQETQAKSSSLDTIASPKSSLSTGLDQQRGSFSSCVPLVLKKKQGGRGQDKKMLIQEGLIMS